jgi:hypothetical protein
MSAKVQRRFKNCKELKRFFAHEDYLTIFAPSYGHIVYRTDSGREHGRYDIESDSHPKRGRSRVGRRHPDLGSLAETF